MYHSYNTDVIHTAKYHQNNTSFAPYSSGLLQYVPPGSLPFIFVSFLLFIITVVVYSIKK